MFPAVLMNDVIYHVTEVVGKEYLIAAEGGKSGNWRWEAEYGIMGQIATPSQVHQTGWKHYALNMSGTFRHRKSKFYTHLDRVNHTLWMWNFFH